MDKEQNKILIVMLVSFFSIFIIFGIGSIGLGIHDKMQIAKKDSYYGETVGTVVAHQVGSSSKRGDLVTYSSIVEYQVKGRMYKVVPSVQSFEKEPIGKERVVRYNPENPSEAYLADGMPDYWFLFFIGSFFIMIPAIILVMILDSRGWASILLFLLIFIIGARLVYYGYVTYGSISPFRLVTLWGYIFLAASGVLLGSVIKMKKSLRANQQSGLSEELFEKR